MNKSQLDRFREHCKLFVMAEFGDHCIFRSTIQVEFPDKLNKLVKLNGNVEHSYVDDQHQTMLVKDLQCTLCNKLISNGIDEYEHHLIFDHKELPLPHYICDICGKVYQRYQSYLTHINEELIEHRVLQKFHCQIDSCRAIYSNRDQAVSHFLSKHQDELDFNIKSEPNKMYNFEKISLTESCKYCLKTFSNSIDLNKHLIEASCDCKLIKGKKSFVISPENNSAAETDKFKNIAGSFDELHSKRPVDRNKQFFKKLQDSINQQRKNSFNEILPVKRPYRKKSRLLCCNFSEFCSTIFNNEDELRDHEFSKHAMDYNCPVCKKNYLGAGYNKFKSHIIRHQKLLKCEKCEASYGCKELLKDHVRIVHDNIKSAFKCDQCSKSYTRRTSLIQHRRFHLYGYLSCRYCNEKFTNRPGLAKHILRKHTIRDRNVLCEVCGKSFLDTNSMSRHKVSVHCKRNYICHFCGNAYKVRKNLRSHCLKIHNFDIRGKNLEDIMNNTDVENSNEILNAVEFIESNL